METKHTIIKVNFIVRLPVINITRRWDDYYFYIKTEQLKCYCMSLHVGTGNCPWLYYYFFLHIVSIMRCISLSCKSSLDFNCQDINKKVTNHHNGQATCLMVNLICTLLKHKQILPFRTVATVIHVKSNLNKLLLLLLLLSYCHIKWCPCWIRYTIVDVLNKNPGLNEFYWFKKLVTGPKTFSVEFSDVLISIWSVIFDELKIFLILSL